MNSFEQHINDIKDMNWQARVPEHLKERFAHTELTVRSVTLDELKDTVPFELAGKSKEGAIYYSNVATMIIEEEKNKPADQVDKLQLLTTVYESPLLSPFEAMVLGATILEFFAKEAARNPIAALAELLRD